MIGNKLSGQKKKMPALRYEGKIKSTFPSVLFTWKAKSPPSSKAFCYTNMLKRKYKTKAATACTHEICRNARDPWRIFS
jgi:hypothetical protein